jgi:regulatory protein
MDLDNIPLDSDDPVVDDPLRVIRHKITRLLAKREHSVAEIQQKLGQQGLNSDHVDDVLAKFIAKDIQSDYRFTFHFVRNCMAKGQGLARIKQALQPDWYELAYEVKCKKYSTARETDWTLKQKQMRFLQYRGFSQDEINFALSH